MRFRFRIKCSIYVILAFIQVVEGVKPMSARGVPSPLEVFVPPKTLRNWGRPPPPFAESPQKRPWKISPTRAKIYLP